MSAMVGMKRNRAMYEELGGSQIEGSTACHATKMQKLRKTARVSFNPYVVCRNVVIADDTESDIVSDNGEQVAAQRDISMFEDLVCAVKDHDGTVLETTVAGQIVQAYIKDASLKTCQKMIDFLESKGLLDLILKVKALILHLIIRIAERGSAGMYKPCYSFHRSSIPMFFTISKALHAAASRLQEQAQNPNTTSFVKSFELTPIVNSVNTEFSVKAC
ncbi:hypothetical protein GUITHDRAFT_155578 [Guillardia theta CCMP2712]|uniref:Uncharacterized protein n=1 Tax=Guillardia theta (strain CCMP2712) TaxID=905079 RepID=L1IGV5_GUITC|nr:hypothetical protein GUITHDRAFT_155578 [Guillardia theta CCMP2712]EKX35065.1 hypothetical protein GUITHDRAFT_155578 [Guillardia theta CCMP2712]|mmetsp:Transcript_27011/g.88325  ORF Transcript_27011/g.88325 Transcript_27011/m.88325 type:complete len:218 (-) Transcript_27011:13-666(-)|eukprot:XP_005822045.1 hypothetical protein GUITHDRAFT_155578 [Guillardia theta CCMP2712]